MFRTRRTYESLNQFYEDLVFFGTGVVLDYEDAEDIFCLSESVRWGVLSVGWGGHVDWTLFVEERRTVSQIVEMFGIENCPDEVKAAWAAKGGSLAREFVVAHSIEPNFGVQNEYGSPIGRLPGQFTWREVYWIEVVLERRRSVLRGSGRSRLRRRNGIVCRTIRMVMVLGRRRLGTVLSFKS